MNYTLHYGTKEVNYVGDKGLQYLIRKIVKLVKGGHGFRLTNNNTGRNIRISRTTKPTFK